MRIIYLSYDGALDPLGSSQVLPYVRGLAARGHEMTLVSFEKVARWTARRERERIASDLLEYSVRWLPQVYHRHPRLLATVFDAVKGITCVRREIRRTGAHIVHCRGDVAMTMGRWATLGRTAALLYDKRGFFADERCDAGSWGRGGFIDRLVRHAEHRNLAAARGVVVLTETARELMKPSLPALTACRVIPTCVDLGLFAPSAKPTDHGLVYSGSLGTWYLAHEMAELARESVKLGLGRPLFVTSHLAEAAAAGINAEWADVVSAPHHEVPGWLRRSRAMFFLIKATPAKKASCPTKLGEALASGLPVLANRGIGDLDGLLEREHVGVLLTALTPEAFRQGLDQLRRLLEEPATAARCRRVAEARFGLERGVIAYEGLYEQMLGRERAAPDRDSARAVENERAS